MTKYDLVIRVNICILASGDDTSFSIYGMQLQTKYKLLSEHTLFKKISTLSVCLFALEIRCRPTVCSYGTSTACFVTYVTIPGTMNYVHRKHLF